jgi:hypothetical protein
MGADNLDEKPSSFFDHLPARICVNLRFAASVLNLRHNLNQKSEKYLVELVRLFDVGDMSRTGQDV